jgi:hypothetical protein
MLKQLKLLCHLKKPEKVQALLERMIKQKLAPLQDCLQICQQFGQLQSSALLNKKIGNYFESV